MIELEENLREKVEKYFQANDVIMFGEESTKNYLPVFSQQSSGFYFSLYKDKVVFKTEEISSHFVRLYALKFNNFTYVGYCPIRQVK